MKNFEGYTEKTTDVTGREIKSGDYIYELVGRRPFFHRVIDISEKGVRCISVHRDNGFWVLYMGGKPYYNNSLTINQLIINELIIPNLPFQLLLAANASIKE